MQQRATPSIGLSSSATCSAALAAALCPSAIAAAASVCETLAVAGNVNQVVCASAHCKCSHLSRHSRQLRPRTCVAISGHALSFAWPLLERSGTSACSRASPLEGPSH
eukprot:5608252-Prymnesium_polylepis.2